MTRAARHTTVHLLLLLLACLAGCDRGPTTEKLERDLQERLDSHFQQDLFAVEKFRRTGSAPFRDLEKKTSGVYVYYDAELELLKDKDFDLSPQADQRISELIDRKVKDQLSDYYDLMDVVHTQGYVNEPVHEAIKEFYSRYEGLSVVNECVRQSIFKYISRFVSHLHTRDYPELFEISKLLPVYIGIFSNQQFNQDVKDLCMDYIGQLLKHYTDKRGKDYQDIKKFVSTVFVDLKFLMEKEVVEMFKTRRKRKPADV